MGHQKGFLNSVLEQRESAGKRDPSAANEDCLDPCTSGDTVCRAFDLCPHTTISRLRLVGHLSSDTQRFCSHRSQCKAVLALQRSQKGSVNGN